MSRRVSTANVENVVNPPVTPVLSRRGSGLSGHLLAASTANTPSGYLAIT
jgi:hypothetical protein